MSEPHKDFGPKYDADMPDERPTVEKRDLKPLDSKLRRFGFKIVSRPRKGPTLWERKGVVVEEKFAHELADRALASVGVTKP